MSDRLGINRYAVQVLPPKPAIKGPALQRLDVLEREAEHLALAARQMRNGIMTNQNRLLTDGMLNSRNWMLSVVMSHLFLQAALEPPYGSSQTSPGSLDPHAFIVAKILTQRAADAGLKDGWAARGV